MEQIKKSSKTQVLIFFALTTLISYILGAPVKAPVPHVDPKEGNDPNDVQAETGLEYDRYLREIVSVLEEDEKFRQKLENTSIDEIKSGAIAHELDYVSHQIRTKLDEIKRREVTRLRDLARQKRAIDKMDKVKVNDKLFPSHIDHSNPHTFEIDDLKRLIKEATKDLEEQDTMRKEEFKRYEMEKEHEKREKMAKLSQEERKKEEEHIKEMDKKHKDHPKVHHPGSKDQLEEVWEESDHLDKEDFNPKTFFNLHDSNQDGFLDELEVESLFERELAKMYDPNNPEDDMVEKEEERNRMREHVFNEIDKDKDFLISMDEFVKGTEGDQYEKDEGWKTVDDEEQFSEEELVAYEKEKEAQRQAEEDKKRKMDAKHAKAADSVKQPEHKEPEHKEPDHKEPEHKQPELVQAKDGAAGHGVPQGGPVHVEGQAPPGPPQNEAQEAKVPISASQPPQPPKH